MRTLPIILACLAISGCVDDQARPRYFAWCSETSEEFVELFLTDSDFGNFPLLLDGDLVSPVEFCNPDKECIAFPLVLDISGDLESENWCYDDICFQIIPRSQLSPINYQFSQRFRGNWVRGVNSEYETETEYFLNSNGDIFAINLKGIVFKDCEYPE